MSSQLNIKISLKLKRLLGLGLIFIMSLFFNQITAQNKKFKVVLDAGHGGKDPGTLGRASYKNSYESDVALKVALNVGKLLKNHSEFKTIYTRTNNKIFVPLHKRGSIANKANADLFISIHCNSAVTNAYGTTTYVLGVGKSAKNLELSKRENDVILLEDDYEKHYDYDPNSDEFMIGLTLMQEDYQDKSIEFAQIVQNKFVSVAKRKNRGVNQGNLAVLYDSYMPSVLIEVGFLTNKNEEKFLHTKSGQLKIAKAIYQAILTYKKRLDNNSIQIINTTNTEDLVTLESDFKEAISDGYFTVQIAMSKKKISLKSYNFKGLKNVTLKKIGKFYKYYYGQANTIEQAKVIQKKVRKIGYPDAFVKRIAGKAIVTAPVVNNEVVQEDSLSQDNKQLHYFSIQFEFGSKKKIKSYNFKGLKNVKRVKSGRFYKYYYGETYDLVEAKKIQAFVIKKGYKDAFVKKLNGRILNETLNLKPKTVNNSSDRIAKNIIFKVQIASGKRKINTISSNFRWLKNIERIKIGAYYKYYYGKTNNYSLISKMHKEAIKKGYTDAIIVAIKNNKLVSLNNVLKNI